MTGLTVTLEIRSRSGKSMGTFTITNDSTVYELKTLVHQQYPKYGPERQWFTIGPENKTILKNGSRLSEYVLRNGDVITFKDLGPQIGWRTVFMIEYFGPILIHSICFFFPELVYGESNKHNVVQIVGYFLVLIHYLKREYESVFVHRFSNSTMPVFNIFKNSFHYWLLGGLFIAYYLYHPKYTAPFQPHETVIMGIATVLFLLSELGNLQCHLILRDLRPLHSTKRGIPRGFLFSRVCCANYTFEIMAWTVFCFATNTLTGYVFLLVSTIQISIWSLKKHNQYKKEFGTEYKILKRNILFPYIW